MTIFRSIFILTTLLCTCVNSQERIIFSDAIADGHDEQFDLTGLAPDEISSIKLRVVDEDNQPIVGAEIASAPFYKPRKGDAMFGAAVPDYNRVKRSNEKGEVTIEYPRLSKKSADELESIVVGARHPDYAELKTMWVGADKKSHQVVMKTTFRAAIIAVDESSRPLKTDLYVICSQPHEHTWEQHKNGLLVSPKYMAQPTSFRIVHVKDGLPTGYSKEIEVNPKTQKRVMLSGVEVGPGVSFRGKVSANVPRPIRETLGVTAMVKFGKSGFWAEKTTVQKDGTFEFKSLPDGESVQVVVMGENWLSTKPTKTIVSKHFPNELDALNHVAIIPQVFELAPQDEPAVVEMEQLEKITAYVTDREGNPRGNITATCSFAVNFFGVSATLQLPQSTRELLTGANPPADEITSQFEYVTDDDGAMEVNAFKGTKSLLYLDVLNGFKFQRIVGEMEQFYIPTNPEADGIFLRIGE